MPIRAEHIPRFGGGDGHITVLPFSVDSIGQGTWAIIVNPSAFLMGYLENTSDADGDNISYKIFLEKGTYTLMILTHKSNGSGILDIDINDVEVASCDLYNVAPQFNQQFTETGIIISTRGIQDIKLRVDGQNGSALGFAVKWSYFALWRAS